MINEKKQKTISVRITESQLLTLTNALTLEKKNLSKFLRESIEKYSKKCRNKPQKQ